ncbi:MAG: zinc ribbon domain-containing protein, partial [Acidimicrobiia bacterium]
MERFENLADLLDLQEVDLQIDRLLHRRSSLPELEQYRAAHERAEELAGRHRVLEGRLRAVGLDLDKAEGELGLAEQKLEQEERRLFAGGMSARETEHMRMEVEQTRRQVSGLEERVLEMLEEKEGLEAETVGAAEALEGARREEAALEGAISEQWKEIDAELARREARKAEIVGPIDPALLDLYEQLRQTKDGVGVGRLVDGVCGGCHLALS